MPGTSTNADHPPRVVVVGSFNQDHVWRSARFPQPGETRLGPLQLRARRQGLQPGDRLRAAGRGDRLRRRARARRAGRCGVGAGARRGPAARCERVEGEATGTAAILLDEAGQNMIVVGPGANLALSVAHIEAQRSADRGRARAGHPARGFAGGHGSGHAYGPRGGRDHAAQPGAGAGRRRRRAAGAGRRAHAQRVGIRRAAGRDGAWRSRSMRWRRWPTPSCTRCVDGSTCRPRW
jgi:hypothetical protein